MFNKILHINSQLEKGGSAVFMNNLSRELSKYNIRNSLFGLRKRKKLFFYKDRYSIKPFLNFIWHRLFGRDQFTTFKNELNSDILNSDIIHLHVIHSYFINYNFLFQLLIDHKKPVVVTLHDKWFFTGRCAIPISCDIHKKYCIKCPSKNTYPKSFADRTHDNLNDKLDFYRRLNDKIIFISPSKWVKESIESIFPEFQILHIPNGIIVPSKIKFSEIKKREKLIFITNDFNDKNKVDISFLKMIISEKFEITLIGKNQPQWTEFVEESINKSIPNQEIFKYLILNKCFILLSKFENYPTILIEALVSGCCILTTKNNGAIEILKEFIHGQDYLFVEEIDVSKITQFLRLNSNLNFAELRSKKAIELFDISITSKKYLEVYNSFYK